MARPKNALPEHATERDIAPETVAYTPPYEPVQPTQPRQMRVRRQSADGAPTSRRFPQIRGGVCEYCGSIDGNYPSQFQYKLCPHYRGMQAWCAYCPPSKDPDDVIYHAVLNVAEDPDHAGELLMWCDSYDCSRAHLEKYKTTVGN